MKLKKLSVINYKNFAQMSYDFSSKINYFIGYNGIGKTNLLDAIYHIAFGRSYFNVNSLPNIKHGEEFFMIEGVFENDEHISCSYKKGLKKNINRNGKAYDKISKHIGCVPLVMISPSDRDLINEGSDIRRKFIDSIISQTNQNYLQTLIRYNKILEQRNALLKQFANRTLPFNKISIKVYDEQLIPLAEFIHEQRTLFLEKFLPFFKIRYQEIISKKEEEVFIVYQSQLQEKKINLLLENNLENDRLAQYTTKGIHKDDLRLELNGYLIKKYGSQGQKKSFLIALKLAQFDFMRIEKDKNPILLLDDIFDKLDEQRVLNLMKLIDTDKFTQIFISDTHKKRVEDISKKNKSSSQIFDLTEIK